jgi:hypothetical protein
VSARRQFGRGRIPFQNMLVFNHRDLKIIGGGDQILKIRGEEPWGARVAHKIEELRTSFYSS